MNHEFSDDELDEYFASVPQPPPAKEGPPLSLHDSSLSSSEVGKKHPPNDDVGGSLEEMLSREMHYLNVSVANDDEISVTSTKSVPNATSSLSKPEFYTIESFSSIPYHKRFRTEYLMLAAIRARALRKVGAILPVRLAELPCLSYDETLEMLEPEKVYTGVLGIMKEYPSLFWGGAAAVSWFLLSELLLRESVAVKTTLYKLEVIVRICSLLQPVGNNTYVGFGLTFRRSKGREIYTRFDGSKGVNRKFSKSGAIQWVVDEFTTTSKRLHQETYDVVDRFVASSIDRLKEEHTLSILNGEMNRVACALETRNELWSDIPVFKRQVADLNRSYEDIIDADHIYESQANDLAIQMKKLRDDLAAQLHPGVQNLYPHPRPLSDLGANWMIEPHVIAMEHMRQDCTELIIPKPLVIAYDEGRLGTVVVKRSTFDARLCQDRVVWRVQDIIDMYEHGQFPPCMSALVKKLLEKKRLGNSEKFMFGNFLMDIGYDPQFVEKVLTSQCTETQYAKDVRNYINSVIRRNKLNGYKCSSLAQISFVQGKYTYGKIKGKHSGNMLICGCPLADPNLYEEQAVKRLNDITVMSTNEFGDVDFLAEPSPRDLRVKEEAISDVRECFEQERKRAGSKCRDKSRITINPTLLCQMERKVALPRTRKWMSKKKRMNRNPIEWVEAALDW